MNNQDVAGFEDILETLTNQMRHLPVQEEDKKNYRHYSYCISFLLLLFPFITYIYISVAPNFYYKICYISI